MSAIHAHTLGIGGKEADYRIIAGDLAVAPDNLLDSEPFDYATALVDLPQVSYRPHGVFRLRSAEAVSDIYARGGKWGQVVYRLKFYFRNLTDAKQLLHLIMDGKAWPAVCLDNNQVPPPARHLRQLVREAWGIVRRDVSARFHANA